MCGQLAGFTPKYQLRIHGLSDFSIIGLFEHEYTPTNYVKRLDTNQEDYELFTIETGERRFFRDGEWSPY